MSLQAAIPTKPVKKLEFEIQETQNGQWKIYKNPNGSIYKEYRTDAQWFDFPMVSIVSGMHPETKKQGTARGIVAIGPRARGVIAVGQFCDGYISIGQFAAARLFAVGQFTLAPIGIGQGTIAMLGLAQFGIAACGIFQMGLTFVFGYGQMVQCFADLFR